MDTVRVPYLPFVGCRAHLDRLPGEIRQHVEAAEIYTVPDAILSAEAESIFRLYLTDLEFFIYPGCHANAEGRHFSNVSYFTTEAFPEALSVELDGVSRTTVSIGLVRHLAGLAAEIYQDLVPILFEGQASLPSPLGDVELDTLMRYGRVVDDQELAAIIAPYPRFFGDNADGGHESEYFFFADMLRFVWLHEWAHGFAGHTRVAAERLGATALREAGEPIHAAEATAILHALEFEADALAVRFMLWQIFSGLDMPGRVVSFKGGLGQRVLWMLLGVSTVIAHWATMERHVPVAQRKHPSAAFRYLNAWDTVRVELLRTGKPQEMTSVNAQAYRALSQLSKTSAAFASLQAATPLVAETPSIKRLRAEVDEHIATLEALGLASIRFDIDFRIYDAVPLLPGVEMPTTAEEP